MKKNRCLLALLLLSLLLPLCACGGAETELVELNDMLR